VIIVVEGPSGAGKTTWCRTHAAANTLLEELPDHATVPTEPHAAAHFWVERNVARWEEVLAREARDGLVVVDTDPFKLHFVWTLFRAGQVTEAEWTMQRDAARDAFAAGRYALADLFLVSDVDVATLRARRESDPSRTRTNFERHVQLRDSVLRWYRAIDRLEPGRVVVGLPTEGVTPALVAKGKRARRSGLELFDQLMRELAAV
jgi:thymidylate kinase